MRFLIVGIGGFLGANARYLVNSWASQRFGAGFPYGTLLINLSGSFALGLFATLAMRFAWSEEARLLIATGFLGAYTTFSTFEFETLLLISEKGQHRLAALYLTGSVLIGFLIAYLGVLAARLLLRGRIG